MSLKNSSLNLPSNGSEDEVVAEANNIIIPYNIFNRYYNNLRNYTFARYIERTYESPFNWYYIVWKPLNKPYSKDPDWFKNKGLDKCRNQVSKNSEVILMTREIHATKVHIHALICSSCDLYEKYHDKIGYNKYKQHVSVASRPADRRRITDYLLKESKSRPFIKFVDYYTFSRT